MRLTWYDCAAVELGMGLLIAWGWRPDIGLDFCLEPFRLPLLQMRDMN